MGPAILQHIYNIYCCPSVLYVHQHTLIHTKLILDNLPRTHKSCRRAFADAHTNTRWYARTRCPPPSSALSGTSLNIHHSGCSESAVNAASHSRESLKPTLSSALPPSFPSLRHTHTLSHTFLAAATDKDNLVHQHLKAQPAALPDTDTRCTETHVQWCTMNWFCDFCVFIACSPHSSLVVLCSRKQDVSLFGFIPLANVSPLDSRVCVRLFVCKKMCIYSCSGGRALTFFAFQSGSENVVLFWLSV